MKIFANNFAVFLTTEPDHRHFRFEGRSRLDIESWLGDEKLLFDGLVAAHYADSEGGESLTEWVRNLLTDATIASKRGQLNMIFPNDAARNKFYSELAGHFKPVVAAGGLLQLLADNLDPLLRAGRAAISSLAGRAQKCA